MSRVIVWFRNDLRLHDNSTLTKASEAGEVIPVYVFDEEIFANNFLGLKKTGYFRAKFLLECVANLRKNLKKQGSNLLIRYGSPAKIVAELAQDLEVRTVYASKEVTQDETSDETKVTNSLKPANIDTELVWDATLYHIRDLPFSIYQIPNIFTEYRKQIESQISVRTLQNENYRFSDLSGIDLGEIPTLSELGYDFKNTDQRSAFQFLGGEDAALQHLKNYIWDKELLKTYKETRNFLIGSEYSSKLSAWLTFGCISPRKIYAEVKKYETAKTSNESTYWLIFELLWRDYFRFIALKNGTRIFKPYGVRYDLNKKWVRDKNIFETWKNGQTGIDFIDANMQELANTGFMSNRGRQNVANYLAKILQIDWTWGATYFESQLIDYDVCNNWGNWNYVAGVGNDPREGRIFNPAKQAQDYDPEGSYRKLWLSRLINV